MLAEPIGDQASEFSDASRASSTTRTRELADLQDWLDDNGHRRRDRSARARRRSRRSATRVTEGSGELVSFTREALTTVIEGSIALILIVVLSVYMLLYGERIGAVVRSIVPRGDGTPADDYPTRVQQAVFGYVRGQLLFSVIMGTSAGVGALDHGLARDLPRRARRTRWCSARVYGFAELIPYIGPGDRRRSRRC